MHELRLAALAMGTEKSGDMAFLLLIQNHTKKANEKS
jgi:hypothetical protein